MTHEVLGTFRALSSIQKRNGIKAARRYIISFTKGAQNIKDVYELNRLAFSTRGCSDHRRDPAVRAA